MLVRQEKSSKLTTPFESNPYVVEGVKGSMVSVERVKDQRKVTRNSSHFKKMGTESIRHNDATAMGGDEQGNEQGEISNIEEGGETLPPDPAQNQEAQSQSIEPESAEPKATRTRYGRTSQKPAWLNDYKT